jgi:tol-pal system protein YbgF
MLQILPIKYSWIFRSPVVPLMLFLAAAPSAVAQNFERPPADVEDRGYGAGGGDPGASVRADRLESQVRTLNGQVEQLQYQVKRLEDMLRKFQTDVEARFQDRGGARPVGPQRRSDVPEEPSPQIAQNPPPVVSPAPSAVGGDGHRHDAFDPANQNGAPGVPRDLGSPDSASKPLPPQANSHEPSGPLDLNPPGLRNAPPPATSVSLEPPVLAPPPNDPVKADYEAASDFLKAQRYDDAQKAFATFLQKHPGTRYNAPAIYHFGESYYFQNRHREAAEQFLKIATDYSKSSVAASAMVKLGISLNALGAKEQACAFFAELPRKYPTASASEKQAAAREAKKAAC